MIGPIVSMISSPEMSVLFRRTERTATQRGRQVGQRSVRSHQLMSLPLAKCPTMGPADWSEMSMTP